MTFLFIRIFFILLSGVAGFFISTSFFESTFNLGLIVSGLCVLTAVMLIIAEMVTHKVSIRNLSAAVFGLVFGLFMSWLLSRIMSIIPMEMALFSTIQIATTLIFCYLGMVISIRGKDEFKLIIPYVKLSAQGERDDQILLDTSVIIDGRIADICETKFIDGKLIVPRFVLDELQHIADSQDALKRNRGRRGLDILNKIRKSSFADVRIEEEDFPDIKDVDAKLVKLAKVLGAKVFTNDYNLNKIAQIQGVTVLNLNDLTNALKPVVLPGEVMDIKIVKEGKEFNQGIGYLEDGTMVVVDNTRYMIGQTIKAVVTSVLQTSAGRMIFAKPEGQSQSQGGRKGRG